MSLKHCINQFFLSSIPLETIPDLTACIGLVFSLAMFFIAFPGQVQLNNLSLIKFR